MEDRITPSHQTEAIIRAMSLLASMYRDVCICSMYGAASLLLTFGYASGVALYESGALWTGPRSRDRSRPASVHFLRPRHESRKAFVNREQFPTRRATRRRGRSRSEGACQSMVCMCPRPRRGGPTAGQSYYRFRQGDTMILSTLLVWS